VTLTSESTRHHSQARSRTARRVRPLAALLAFSLTIGQVAPAFAIDETTRVLLRKLSSDGVAAYQDGDYQRAVEKLEKAWSILQTAPLGLWSGRALEKAGRLVEASERYMAAKRAPLDRGGDRDAQESARAEAEAAYEAVQPRVPTITLQFTGAQATELTVVVAGKTILPDFVGLPVPVDPGTVDVSAQRGTEPAVTTQVSLREGDHEVVTLDFRAAGAEGGAASAQAEGENAPADTGPSDAGARKGSWQPVAGWIGVGLGGASLILGGITGGMVLSKWQELGCGDGAPLCDAGPDETAPINDLRTVSTIGFIAGGVLAAAGITLLLTAPKKPREVALRPYFGFDSVGITGTFQ